MHAPCLPVVVTSLRDGFIWHSRMQEALACHVYATPHWHCPKEASGPACLHGRQDSKSYFSEHLDTVSTLERLAHSGGEADASLLSKPAPGDCLTRSEPLYADSTYRSHFAVILPNCMFKLHVHVASAAGPAGASWEQSLTFLDGDLQT